MVNNNYYIYSIKFFFEIIKNIFYFPFWWYSRGVWTLIIGLKNFLILREKSLALLVWVKNIFRPMYSQHDTAGILISFFVRLFQIIFRSIVMCFWIFLPILTIYEIFFQLK